MITREHWNQAGIITVTGLILTIFCTAGTAEWILSSRYAVLEADYAVLAEKETTNRAEIESMKADFAKVESDRRISDELLLKELDTLQATWSVMQSEMPPSRRR